MGAPRGAQGRRFLGGNDHPHPAGPSVALWRETWGGGEPSSRHWGNQRGHRPSRDHPDAYALEISQLTVSARVREDGQLAISLA
jgi:hypothetical protein